MSNRVPSIDQRILGYSPAARKLLYATIACSLLAVLLVLGQALLVSNVINRVFLGHETLKAVQSLLGFVLLLAIARAVLVWLADSLAQKSASRLKNRMREDLLNHLATLGPAFNDGERSGELAHSILAGIEDLDEYMAAYQPLRALAALVPLLVALVVCALDPLSVLVLLATGPALVLFLVLIGSRTKVLTERRFLEMSWMSAHFLDVLQGLATLKMFGRSKEQVELVGEISRSYGSSSLDVLRSAFETSFVLELSTTIATALVAVEVGLRLTAGNISFPHALAVLIVTPEFFLPLRQLSMRYHASSTGRTAAARIFALLDAAPPPTRLAHLLVRKHLSKAAEIRLSNVSFAYSDGKRPALENISFTIPTGMKVALIGSTGSGKTTIADLLLRFRQPTSGSIRVGGTPLDEIDLKAWRSQIAWVPQAPHLFFGTVAENIRLGRPDASAEETRSAAAAACADKFIRDLPMGYDTMVGDNGVRLSGGQKQRIAIARALLKDAPFLILDEATSQLDAANRALAESALNRLLEGRTALIIGHDLSMADRADRIVVLSQGRSIESSDHQSVLARTNGDSARLIVGHERSLD